MKRIVILSVILLNGILTPSLFGMPSLIEPDASLKSPRMVLNEIDSYWKKIDTTDGWKQMVNNPEEYAKDVKQAGSLLIDALLASHMCNEICADPSNDKLSKMKNHHELRLGNHHRFMSAWHAEQMDPADDLTNYDRIQSDIYEDMHRWNSKEAEECKEKLAQAIMNLHQHYMYGKTHLNQLKKYQD